MPIGGRGLTRWTPEEDAAIRELYPGHAPSWDGWDEVLPGRTRASICTRAKRIGATFRGSCPPWTPEEDEALMRLYPAWGPARCAREAPELAGRTAGSCYMRARRLGIASERRERARATEAQEEPHEGPEGPEEGPEAPAPPAPLAPATDRVGPGGLPVARPTWVTAPVRVLWWCPSCGRPNGALMGGHQVRQAMSGTGAWVARCSGCGRESWLAGMSVKELGEDAEKSDM